MAGPACKKILNGVMGALAKAIEDGLTDPLVRGVMLPAAECDKLIQEMANSDLQYYLGEASPVKSPRGLSGVLMALHDKGVVTDEVFEVLRHPGNPPVPVDQGAR
jgi:hypothetical protein